MTDPHPLDRPIWNTLATRHANLAEGDGLARRFRPAVNMFGAARDDGTAALAALAALVPTSGALGLVEAIAPPPVPGTRIVFQAQLYQMLLAEPLPPMPPRDDLDWVDLGDDDAPDMLALATLTKPGPFFAQTHRLGRFIGIRRGGALVAMAGERMKVPGFAEVSAVCTHPDWRGHGLGIGLMRVAIERMLAEGDAVFLHAYPDNPAVALYQALGFRVRREMCFTIVERTGASA
ncbi:MAG: GNAT family N-acetyltransferase [Sphingomonas sp.]